MANNTSSVTINGTSSNQPIRAGQIGTRTEAAKPTTAAEKTSDLSCTNSFSTTLKEGSLEGSNFPKTDDMFPKLLGNLYPNAGLGSIQSTLGCERPTSAKQQAAAICNAIATQYYTSTNAGAAPRSGAIIDSIKMQACSALPTEEILALGKKCSSATTTRKQGSTAITGEGVPQNAFAWQSANDACLRDNFAKLPKAKGQKTP